MAEDDKKEDVKDGDHEGSDELKECQAKAEEYLNGWKRAQADFINYKKEEVRRLSELSQYASESILMELFDVLDNLDALMREIPKEVREKHKDWLSGLEQTEKLFDELLAKNGVKKINVKGEKFDPVMHEAVSGGDLDGDSIEEVRAGYIINDRVIRPSRVVVKRAARLN